MLIYVQSINLSFGKNSYQALRCSEEIPIANEDKFYHLIIVQHKVL